MKARQRKRKWNKERDATTIVPQVGKSNKQGKKAHTKPKQKEKK